MRRTEKDEKDEKDDIMKKSCLELQVGFLILYCDNNLLCESRGHCHVMVFQLNRS